MKVSLNALAQSFDPWDLSIDLDGKTYTTRPWTLADSKALDALKHKTEEEGYQFFLGLFAGDDAPDVRAWEADTASYVIAAILAYKEELTKKNSMKIRASVAAGLKAGS